MLSDYEKIEFLRVHNYFETNIISEVIKYIKFQCMRYLVKDSHIELDGFTFDDYLQPWIDQGFTDKDFENFLQEQSANDNVYHEYKNIYNKLAKFLNQKIAKPKDTKATYFFTKTSKIKFEYTAYRLIKQAIVELTNINHEALDTKSLQEYKLLLEHKQCHTPDIFKNLKLKNHLEIYINSKNTLSLKDFEKHIKLPSIINDNILKDKTLAKTLFIEGLSGSGKTVLAQRIAYEVSSVNTFYIDLSDTTTKEILNKYDNEINSFILNIKHSLGTIILDNINFSIETIAISKKILLKCYEIDLKIILVAQYEIINNALVQHNFHHVFFMDNILSNIHEHVYYLELSNQKQLLELRYSIIESLILFYSNKDYRYENISHDKVIKIESEYGCILKYIKFSIDSLISFNIDKISRDNVKSLILNEYYEIFDLSVNKEFKFALTLISSYDKSIFIPHNSYKVNLIDEPILLNKLVDKRKIFLVNDTYNYKIFFPHQIIPLTLISAITKKERRNLEALILDTVNYLLLLHGKVLHSFLEAYLYSDFFTIIHLIKIFEFLIENVPTKRKYILNNYMMDKITDLVADKKDYDKYLNFIETKGDQLYEKFLF